MQQTEKYKLNLIEKEDVFSPDALNENMEKLEVALEGKTDAADTGALDARVTALEVHKIAIGHYIGNGETNQCQRRYEIVRKRRRNFVIFRRRGVTKIRYGLAQKECSRFAVSGA